MTKKLVFLFLLLISVAGWSPVAGQNATKTGLRVLSAPDIGHICTIDPTHENAHFHITPGPELRRKMEQSSVQTMFEVDYEIEQGNSCGDSQWPQEARAAVEYALDIWSVHVRSDVLLRVNAVWSDIESESGTTLGRASPSRIVLFEHEQEDTWFSIGQLSAMSGEVIRDQIEVEGGGTLQHDIYMEMNCDFNSWYFETDGNTPAGEIDFVTVVLHEIGHGLGFFGTMASEEDSDVAGWGVGNNTLYPLVYDRFAVDGDRQSLLNTSVYPNPSSQLLDALTGQRGGVFFQGEDALFTLQGHAADRAVLYSPSEWSPGSSYSHVDQETFSQTVNGLMRPRIDRALALHSPGPLMCGMFSDMGWPLGTGCLSFLSADAIIAFNRNEMNAGVINAGETTEETLVIQSSAESAETLSGFIELETDNDNDYFSISGLSEFSLEPGESVEIPVQYHPATPGQHTAVLSVFHNAKNEQPPALIGVAGEALPEDEIVVLDQSFPNPVMPASQAPVIPFAISQDSNVRLDLYTISGQHVRSLVQDSRNSGRYAEDVDISGLASGIYIYRIIVDDVVKSKKLMLFQ